MMTRPSKLQLLLVTLIVVAGSSLAHAQAGVTAKDEQAAKFEPATVNPEAKLANPDYPDLTVRDELASDQTEGGSCQVVCHPAFTVNSKTHLVKIDLNKIK